MPHALANSTTRFIARHTRALILGACVLLVASMALASRLRVDQELRALLPASAPSVLALDAASATLGQPSDLLVVLRGPDRASNLRYGAELATRLRAMPDFRFVAFHFEREFFEKNLLLYADLEAVLRLRTTLRDYLRERVAAEAFGDFALGDPSPERGDSKPRSEPRSLVDQWTKTLSADALARQIPAYYETDEGRIVVLQTRPVAPSTDLAAAEALEAAVERVARDLDPSAFHPELRVELEGAYIQHVRRVRMIRKSVFLGSIGTLVVIFALLWLMFRRALVAALLFVPLLLAVGCALAFAALAYGQLNIVSAFMFAILLGIGIDFGIHVVARYDEERQQGLAPEAAVRSLLQGTAPATAAGAASSAASFLWLLWADFRGFSEFGLVAALGTMLALGAALVVLPALLLAFGERIRVPVAKTVAGSRANGRWRRRTAVPFALLATVLTLAGGAALPALEMEHDLSSLERTKRAGETRRSYRDAIGRSRTVDPIVVMTRDAMQGERLSHALEALTRLPADQFSALEKQLHGTLPAAPTDPSPTPSGGTDSDGTDTGGTDTDSTDTDAFEDDDFWENSPADRRFDAMQATLPEAPWLRPEVLRELALLSADQLRVIHTRLVEVFSIHRFVPTDQPAKLEVIEDMRNLLASKWALLPKDVAEELGPWRDRLEVRSPVRVEDLPAWTREPFLTADGTLGPHVVLATAGSKGDYDTATELHDTFASLPTTTGEVQTAATFFVIPEIVQAIRDDAPIVLAGIVGALVLCAWLTFRSLADVALVAGTVSCGMAMLALVMVAFDWKINFINMIAFPLIVGMGQDDALQILQRCRERSGDVVLAVRETAPAVFATTATTIGGFGGMIFTDHAGLRSLGLIVVTGLASCYVASVVALPAVLLALGPQPRREPPAAPG